MLTAGMSQVLVRVFHLGVEPVSLCFAMINIMFVDQYVHTKTEHMSNVSHQIMSSFNVKEEFGIMVQLCSFSILWDVAIDEITSIFHCKENAECSMAMSLPVVILNETCCNRDELDVGLVSNGTTILESRSARKIALTILNTRKLEGACCMLTPWAIINSI